MWRVRRSPPCARGDHRAGRGEEDPRCGGGGDPIFGTGGSGGTTTTTAATTTTGDTTTTTTTAGNGSGGGEPTCDPSQAMNACDTCVYGACCAEAARCEPGTPCDASVICADQAGCIEMAGDFLTCATKACPDQATTKAVNAYQELSTCVRANCESPCGP